MATKYWPDEYIQKRRTAKAALNTLRAGQRVFVGSSCGEPQHLVQALVDAGERF